ncbi:MAG: PIN domain-containing protein [Gammaproteobacteria bacterium]|nr:PIN domain-containing protein [Gammaproteobacteria bacterium]
MPANDKVIIDTCLWIEFFRSKSELSDRVKALIRDKQVAGTGIILSELLQGARGEKERNIISTIFSSLEYIEMTRELWIKAGTLAGKLRSQGKTIPLSDISIACCAMENDYRVFTIDKHFQDIPEANLY